MTDPVVSSRFGSRPLVNVPAMQVYGNRDVEVPTLQAPSNRVNTNPFPGVNNPMLGSGTYKPPPTYSMAAALPPSLPPVPGMPYAGLQQRLQSAPAPLMFPPAAPQMFPQPVPQMFPQPAPQMFYGPQGEMVPPGPFSDTPVAYPGMAGPFPSYPPAPQPQPMPVRVVPQAWGPRPGPGIQPGFNVTCELEYGRIMTIDVRDCIGEFRGIPDFMKRELMRTYGGHPYTEVNIKFEGGEFHIFATHDNRQKFRLVRRRRASDSESDEDDRQFRFNREYDSDIPSFGSESGIRRRGDMRARGITHEKGWNRRRDLDTEVPSFTSERDIRERQADMRPRGITQERGWNNRRDLHIDIPSSTSENRFRDRRADIRPRGVNHERGWNRRRKSTT